MDRRSFLTSLLGGLAAAGLGGTAFAGITPTPALAAKDVEELPAGTAGALDRTEADFSRHRRHRRYYRRYYRRRYRPRYYYRPYPYYYRRPRYYYYRRPRRYYYYW